MGSNGRAEQPTANELKRRISRHEAARSRTVGDDTFIISLREGATIQHRMDRVGTYIWQLADGTRTGEEMARAVARHYDADLAAVTDSVARFVHALHQSGLVTLEGCTTPAFSRQNRRSNLPVPAQVARFYGAADEKCVPLVATLTLTHACNLKCYYCYDAGQRGRALDFSHWRDILDQIAEAGTLCIRLSGGEPTAHPDFMLILEYAVQRGFVTSVVTNGTLITPELAERLGRLALESVAVSFHGGSPDVHDRLAGRNGAFERSCHGVALLREHGVKVIPGMVVTRRNFDDVDNFARLSATWGLSQPILSIAVYARTNGATDTLNDRLSLDQIRNLMSRGWYRPFPNLYCGAARTKYAITPNGRVTPCQRLMIEVGDLERESFADIWRQSPALCQMREERWFADPDQCRTCPAYQKYCSRCPAQAYYEQGQLRATSSFDCQLVPVYLQLQQTTEVSAPTQPACL
ncbi:MAG TPA: PqqD family peptide modification chaperone [Anaerolineae bacterium]|nr:PqqD family peptide modification chaperone [Anaerolineae bacterium]